MFYAICITINRKIQLEMRTAFWRVYAVTNTAGALDITIFARNSTSSLNDVGGTLRLFIVSVTLSFLLGLPAMGVFSLVRKWVYKYKAHNLNTAKSVLAVIGILLIILSVYLPVGLLADMGFLGRRVSHSHHELKRIMLATVLFYSIPFVACLWLFDVPFVKNDQIQDTE